MRSGQFRYSTILRFILGIGLMAFATNESLASADLRRELAAVAKSVTQLLEGQGHDSIAIGQFTGPPTFPTSAGPGIVKAFAEEFQKLGINVKKRAAIGLKGEYQLAEVEDAKLKHAFLAVQIRGSLVDQFGQVLTDFSFKAQAQDGGEVDTANINQGNFDTKIRGEDTLFELIAPNVKLPPDDPMTDRDRRIRESISDPSSRIVGGTKVAAGPGSPYSVEVLVSGKPRSITLDEGLPYVRVDKGEVYEIRITNNANHDAAVRLTIDGLSVFEFSEIREERGPRKGEPKYSVYVVPSRSTVQFKGWHKNNKQVDSFLVTEYASSAAALLNQTGSDLGTITVQFSAAWPINADPPSDEPPLRRSGPNATGFGPPKKDVVEEVQRRIGVVRAAVSVRYTKPR